MRTNKLNLNDEVIRKTVGELPKPNDNNKEVVNEVSRVFGFKKPLMLKITNEKKKFLEIEKKRNRKEFEKIRSRRIRIVKHSL